MAAGGDGSGLFARPLLLLLPLLLPPRPALGNEGAAAGSCECERYRTEPLLVKRFPDRLVTWEPCGALVRFTFPLRRVCGLADDFWVRSFIALKREKRKGAARPSSPKTCCQPSPTSRAPLLPLSSRGPTLEGLTETPQSEQLPVFTPETPQSEQLPVFTTASAALAPETRRSLVLPQNGAVAAVSPGPIPQEVLPAQPHQAAVLSGLATVLFLVAGIVSLACWWRSPRRRRAALVL